MIRTASVCLAFYWLVIFIGTHLPASSLANFPIYSDKLCHVLAFLGLAFLLAWALPKRGKKLRQITVAAAVALGYSFFDELTQSFVPGRSCDVWDVAADAVGVMIGLAAYVVVRALLIQMRFGRSPIHGLSR